LAYGALLVALVAPSVTHGAAALPNSDQEYLALLVDVGSGMQEPASGSSTKWRLAQWRTNQFLSLVHRRRLVSLFTYSAAEVRQVTPFQAPTQVKTAFSALTPSSNASAPFANAVCTAAAELRRAATDTGASLRLYVQSSGAEDNSAASLECFGPTSTRVYPDFESASWQFQTRNALLTDGYDNTTDARFQCLFDADIYRSLGTTPVVDTRVIQFMTLLAEESGGTTVQFDGSTTASAWPRFGDNTEDGCVNEEDTVETTLWVSEELEPTHPLTRRLDVNRDGTINNLDRLGVSAGCAGP